MASAKACDAVYHVEVPPTGKKLRELLYSAFYNADHAVHFYILAAPDFVLGPDAPPAERLRAFVSAFLRRRFDTSNALGWGPLFSREMRHPREIVRPIVDKHRKATRHLLDEIVAQFLGKCANQETIERCAASVFGQIIYYFHGHFARAARARGEHMTAERIEELAEHFTRFSAGGIEDMKGKGRRCKR